MGMGFNMRGMINRIGLWLSKEKKCQRDEYSQGYIIDARLGESFVFDVLGIRYEVYEENTSSDYLHFHGHAIKIENSEKSVTQSVSCLKNWIDNSLLPQGSKVGLDTLSVYISYPAEKVSDEIRNLCNHEGIGVLLCIKDEDEYFIDEVIEPKQIDLCRGYNYAISHTQQRSPGNFESHLRARPCLYEVFNKRPDLLFDAFIRPKQKQYYNDLGFGHVFDVLKNNESKKALKYLCEGIRQNSSPCNWETRGRKYNENTIWISRPGSQHPTVTIRTTSRYIVLTVGESSVYRVWSEQNVKKIEDSRLVEVGGIDRVLEKVVYPLFT
ncbi:hypothetical protein J2129_002625 [Methanofollis sp. W23]|nr:hypothetical protein [Methanofollis sp. W23]